MIKKTTVSAFAKRKANGQKIVMITAYDAPFAAAVYDAGIDIILVGDSVATTAMGCDTTLTATMDIITHHTKMVRRGAPNAFIVFDMPFMSYQVSAEDAMRNAAKALQDAGADAIKFEGGREYAPLVERLVNAGIPVMGHLGLLPQRVNALGGYKVAGRTELEAQRLLEDAKALENAGVFSIVLECVPAEIGSKITESLTVPTIGIGSGSGCSGQVQVLHDVLGLLPFSPKHAKKYTDLSVIVREAIKKYADEVQSDKFPTDDNSF